MSPVYTLTPAPTANPPTVPVPPSRWTLLLQGYVALLVAVLIGTLISAPALYSGVRCYNETTYLLGARPADDERLSQWARSRPDVVSFTTERRGAELWVRSEYHSVSQQPPIEQVVAKMRALGYEFAGMRGISGGMLSTLGELLTNAKTLAMMLAGIQVAFGVVGLNRIRAAAKAGAPLPPLFPGRHGWAIAVGALAGLGMLGLGQLNSFVLNALLGHPAPSPWDASAAMPAATKWVFLLFGGFGAPIAEEIFFRGYLFGKFKSAGYVWFGALVSALWFGLIHFSDSYNVPGICLYGLILAWLYHRTKSLLAPITAHSVNNVALIGYMALS